MKGLPDALARRDENLFSELCYGAVVPYDEEGEASLPMAGPFFEFLITTAHSTEFLGWPGAGSLYVIFYFGWERLTVEQRQRLLVTIRETFPQMASTHSTFEVQELLVEKFDRAEACRVFEEFVHHDSQNQRHAVEWGFEMLLESGPAPEIYRRCKNCMTILTHDPDEDIRECAIYFLEGLARNEAGRAARGLPESTRSA